VQYLANRLNLNETEPIRYQFKIVLLGDGGAGKTCLTNRFCYNLFENTKLTIGLSFNSYSLPAEEAGKRFKIGLSIWDFGGQPRFRPLLPQFINGANAALYVHDLLVFHSLLDLKTDWYPLLHENAGKVPTFLVGTKEDLLDDKNSLDMSVIEEYQQKLEAKKSYITSAKTGLNIEKIFKDLVREILKQPPYSLRDIILL
jgi:small GTP-binding protein